MKSLASAIACAAILAAPVMALADVSVRESAQAAQMINGWRGAHGLPPVRADKALNGVAAVQTQAMMAQGVMSHEAGGDFRTRMRTHGVRGTAAENIAAGTDSITVVMQMWQQSPGHNANLLNPELQRVALAKGVTPAGQVYWTLVMAAR